MQIIFYNKAEPVKEERFMKKIIFVLVFGTLSTSSAYNNIKKISSTNMFYRMLTPSVRNQLTLAAVLFYDSSQGMISKQAPKE